MPIADVLHRPSMTAGQCQSCATFKACSVLHLRGLHKSAAGVHGEAGQCPGPPVYCSSENTLSQQLQPITWKAEQCSSWVKSASLAFSIHLYSGVLFLPHVSQNLQAVGTGGGCMWQAMLAISLCHLARFVTVLFLQLGQTEQTGCFGKTGTAEGTAPPLAHIWWCPTCCQGTPVD